MTSYGTIIIPAHNEEAVIGRTLDALAEVRANPAIRIIVVCNGCTDQTANVARSRHGVVLVDLEEASKTSALRAGDRLATSGPRIYLDADVQLTSRAAIDVIHALRTGGFAGRPAHIFDTRGASVIVRSWYRVRASLPSIESKLWGAGCYALSEAGRQRFDEFPEIVSDDLFIDGQFTSEEVTIFDTDPVVVSTPRRTQDLLRILKRSYRTQTEVSAGGARLSTGQRGQLQDLTALLAHSPARMGDIFVYLAIIAFARLQARASSSTRWERDASSRNTGP